MTKAQAAFEQEAAYRNSLLEADELSPDPVMRGLAGIARMDYTPTEKLLAQLRLIVDSSRGELPELRATVDAAVIEERERCAKVARDFLAEAGMSLTGRLLDAMIRAKP